MTHVMTLEIFPIGLSIAIGVYQGCYRSKQLTTNEFLIADGQMKVDIERRQIIRMLFCLS
jgi:hypothetical protein